jgi:UDP-glucose 6-dehydrogenase
MAHYGYEVIVTKSTVLWEPASDSGSHQPQATRLISTSFPHGLREGSAIEASCA